MKLVTWQEYERQQGRRVAGDSVDADVSYIYRPYRNDIEQHIFTQFPLHVTSTSADEMHLVASINIAICHIMHFFLPTTATATSTPTSASTSTATAAAAAQHRRQDTSTDEWIDPILSYIQDALETTGSDGQQQEDAEEEEEDGDEMDEEGEETPTATPTATSSAATNTVTPASHEKTKSRRNRRKRKSYAKGDKSGATK